jgi:hypothetical protein
MKASMHNGREGSGKHNDRTFLQGKSEQDRQEMAPHIDPDMTAKNRTWRIGHKDKGWLSGAGGDIEAAERAYYKKAYSAAQEAKNARYRAQRHPERCRSTDDLYTGKLTRPEEQILQIGSKDDQVSPETFYACMKDYVKGIEDWNRAHGRHMKVLSIAIHFDESTPHAHIRRVWEYDGRDGRAIGQDKALEAAGVPLPDPDKPKGRHNNRKMTFDREMRDMWLDICERHGLNIDREPVPDMRHKDKADFIRDQIAQEIQQGRAEVAAVWEAYREADDERDEMRRRAEEAWDGYKEASEEFELMQENVDCVREDLRKAQGDLERNRGLLKQLRADIGKYQARVDALRTSIKMLSAAEVAEIPEQVKTPLWGLLGRDNVIISRKMLDKLVKTAEVAEKAARETVALSAEKRRIEREARAEAKQLREQALAQGQREARALVDRAEEQAGSYYELRKALDHYRRLENRYPEHFEAMDQAERERKNRHRSHELDR